MAGGVGGLQEARGWGREVTFVLTQLSPWGALVPSPRVFQALMGLPRDGLRKRSAAGVSRSLRKARGTFGQRSRTRPIRGAK
jgi:hypothetical protein